MKMPGFSAEASLDHRNDVYRASTSVDWGSGKAYPAQRMPLLSDTVTVKSPLSDVGFSSCWGLKCHTSIDYCDPPPGICYWSWKCEIAWLC